ncbi:MAG: GTP-binding protein [Myxococcota bacterium]
MKIIALVGPFGAGKSTVAMNLAAWLAKQGQAPDQMAIVVNEAGGSTEITTPHSKVFSLPNGCFTCQDEAVLQQALQELAENGTQVVLMEGFGIVSGDETKAFLRKVPYPHLIVGILDVANWSQNLVNYGELLPTHLRVADVIVATKQSEDVLPADIQAFLEDHHVHATVTRGPIDAFPATLWPAMAVALEAQHSPHEPSGHHNHDHHDHDHQHDDDDHHHDHDHDHHHHHHNTHDWQPQVLDLTSQATLVRLKSVAQDLVSAGKLRLKGRLKGNSFNVAPGATNWQTKTATEPGDLVICYLAPDTEWPTELLGLVNSRPEASRSHQLLRVDTNVEATVSALQKGIETVRSWEPRIGGLAASGKQLVTHPEQLQIWKEMARRPSVKADWFAPTMEACLEYWVKCAGWVIENASSVDPGHLPTHQRELGVSLAWWTIEFADQLPEELVERVIAVQPAALVEAGLRDVAALRSDGFWRYWQGLELLRALRFRLRSYEDSARQGILSAAQRVIEMAQTGEERTAFQAEFAIAN